MPGATTAGYGGRTATMATRNPGELVSALKVLGLFLHTIKRCVNLVRYSGHQNGCGQPLQSASD